MSCADCHNPHGSVLLASIRTFNANERACFRCHGEKSGPFTFEHAPIRLEGCAACHEPHGSANPRMLVRQEVYLVCLDCHSNLPVPRPTNAAIGVTPPAFHDLRSPRFRNCTVCHLKVHGSYVDQNFLK
jgi:DmsE family decaheme c-type cytochrome